jgi:hypothetical protein
MSVAETAIRVHGLEKSCERLHFLRGVDLDVARGGILRSARHLQSLFSQAKGTIYMRKIKLRQSQRKREARGGRVWIRLTAVSIGSSG